ncbi:MAG: TetR/AcrR family transcriptional regulator [Leptospirales bacterium]|nr:TetR/AcrR family transcriptional regulator [Leptospirales bacterium]
MELTFENFSKESNITLEYIWSNYFKKNRIFFKIKNENIAVKNLISIFNATIKLSNEIGFQAMTLRALSKESKLSMGAMYNYFPSKDDLFKIIHIYGLNLITNIMNNYLKDETSPEQKMKISIRIHIYLSEILPQWFYFLYMETKNLKREDRKIPMESELFTEKLFTDILSDGIKTGVYAERNIILTASMIKAMLQDWYLKRWKYTKRKINVEQYASFVIEFIESYIKI